MEDRRIQALTIYATEHYGHARYHEYLRSQVTSILSASSIVLFGFAIEQLEKSPMIATFAGAVVLILGILNLVLNFLHSNRFRTHVSAAQAALRGVEGSDASGDDGSTIEACRKVFEAEKYGKLTLAWNVLPVLVGFMGSFIFIQGIGNVLVTP